MPSTPVPTHTSALRLFFQLLAGVLRVLRDVLDTKKLFAAMEKAVAREAQAREHVGALERTLDQAKVTLKSSKEEAKQAMTVAVAADSDVKDRISVLIGGPQ